MVLHHLVFQKWKIWRALSLDVSIYLHSCDRNSRCIAVKTQWWNCGLFTALHTLGLIRVFWHDKSGSKPQYQGIEPSGPDSRYYLTFLSLDFDLRTETCSGRSLTPFFQAWPIGCICGWPASKTSVKGLFIFAGLTMVSATWKLPFA